MAAFQTFADTPNQIHTEGQEIVLSFDRLTPTTGKVSWNIPAPANGCNAETQAYNGIIIVVDTKHPTTAERPVDGTKYSGDSSTNSDLHAGDTLHAALIVGSFYNDKTTTTMTITDLDPDSAYYVSAYAVDAQLRYHSQGTHAFALDARTTHITDDTHGYHVIVLGQTGVQPTDATGLQYGETYTFTLTVDGKDYTISVAGDDSQTYEDLIAAVSNEISRQSAQFAGSTAPNAGTLYWDTKTKQLFQWTGAESTLKSVLVEPTDPTVLTPDTFWYVPSTDTLQQWTSGTWSPVRLTTYGTDPSKPGCDDYWYDGNVLYQSTGTAWVDKPAFIQPTDPAAPTELECGAFWFDETNELLRTLNAAGQWEHVDVIYHAVDPSALPDGTYWLNDSTEVLSVLVGQQWDVREFTQSSTQPDAPSAGDLWFDTSADDLFVRDVSNTQWDVVPLLIRDTDPTIRVGGDVWWDSDNNIIHVWDSNAVAWVAATQFIEQEHDPIQPRDLDVGTLWVDTENSLVYKWDGSQWMAMLAIFDSTAPTVVSVGDVWRDTTTSSWKKWDGSGWVEFDPVDSETSPEASTMATGTLWYNTTANELFQWNGLGWTSVLFVTTDPAPALGTTWYDTISHTLTYWTGSSWSASPPVAYVDLIDPGHIKFISHSAGSTSTITATDVNLFASLDAEVRWITPSTGADGLDGIPSYRAPGVGTDGTADERRKLANTIMIKLGYPTVNVELTKQQIDSAIDTALDVFRTHSGSAYKRAYFFMDVLPGVQQYTLTNKTVGFNKIVGVMGIHRMSSAFLATNGGTYGQSVLQHLYSMGGFDLVSFTLMHQYIELMEDVFASRIMYQWDEHTRSLQLLKRFAHKERVLVDASIERTEQELMNDRWTKQWIEKYALAQSRLILAEIRGKFASLPGAGGGVSLNAADLITKAESDIDDLMMQLDDFVVNSPEEYGMGSTLVVG